MEPLSRITAATVDVLEILVRQDDPCWGLLIIKQTGRPAGSVYPILDRLETAGWVTSSWEDDATRPGPRRRYYELTDDGATAAAAAIRRLRTPSVSPRTATA
jgi:PadR family transcriptional regulator, regulatory protein PadR